MALGWGTISLTVTEFSGWQTGSLIPKAQWSETRIARGMLGRTLWPVLRYG